MNQGFLGKGGEMGELMRAMDWSKTPVGPIDQWPQSLRTALGIILNSKFPMFLWWGPDLICFYNDAYRPSLGNEGKHPSILGMPAIEAWPEIWDFIKPLIDQVLDGGEAVWFEDQFLPIYRNGRMEDVYWTFSYSPVNDESGKVAGVLVTCNETTGKVNLLKALQESNIRYLNNIKQAPVAMCVLRGGNLVVEIVNDLILDIWGKKEHEVVSRPLFEGLPEARGQGLEKLLEDVYHTGRKFEASERPVKLLTNGRIETKYLNFIYEALTEPDGSVSGVVVIASEVTSQVMARKKVEESERRFRNTVKQVPLGIAILKGNDFMVEMSNDAALKIIDRKEEEFVNRPVFDVIPETKITVEPLLREVVRSGIPFHTDEFAVMLNRYGKQEIAYFSLVFYPMREGDDEISGVIIVAYEVTEAVKIKHALAESAKEFRKLMMESPIPMCILRGEDFVIEMANTAMFVDIWKKTENECLGQKILELFPELNDQKYPELLNRVYKTGKSHKENESLAYVHGPDGMNKFYLDYDYSPLFEKEGNISGIIITVNDVTERVEARKKVEMAEERVRLATEVTGLATWDLNLITGELAYSLNLPSIFGYDGSPGLTHSQFRSHIHPDDLKPLVEASFERSLETGINKYEARIIKVGGNIAWLRSHGRVFYDAEGKPVKMIGSSRDITEEINSQEVLRESEQKFRLLADSMPQHVWTSDSKGELNYFNRSVYTYSGLSEQDVMNGRWIQIVHPDDREENIGRWRRSMETGEDFLFEHRFRRHDGEYRWQLSRAIPQKDKEGNIQMWVGTSTDIQDQKTFTNELERQVRERTHELEQKNTDLIKMNIELESFAYVSSHDLQEPLRKIQTFGARIMATEFDGLSENTKNYLGKMQDAANRMQTLIKDLLTYSRTNSAERIFVRTNLAEIAEEVKSDFREAIEEKKAVVEAEHLCDATVITFQFRQLLHNLVSNALKFTQPGVKPHIIIKAEKIQGSLIESLDPVKIYCHLAVSDNGIGFDQEYKSRIFEVFQRLHSERGYSGTGIGLAIVKKIVDNHNGLITASGEINNGARFDIYIPDEQTVST